MLILTSIRLTFATFYFHHQLRIMLKEKQLKNYVELHIVRFSDRKLENSLLRNLKVMATSKHGHITFFCEQKMDDNRTILY